MFEPSASLWRSITSTARGRREVATVRWFASRCHGCAGELVRIVGHVREEKRKVDGKTAVVRETIRENAALFYFLSTTVSNAAAFDHGASGGLWKSR
jgi:hypothetical protein